MSDDAKLIAIDQLKIGMFIKLDLSWFEHSFPMSSFKITNQDQLNELHALKLKHVRYFPSKSDLLQVNAPSNPNVAGKSTTNNLPPTAQVFNNIIEAKRARFEKLTKQREELARCEAKFVEAATVVKGINKTIFSQPEQTIKEANKLVDSVAEIFLNSNDTVMHLIQQTGANEELYFHTLNVSVLAMMLASEMKCTEAQIKSVGLAALFHDLGKVNVPEKILNKTEALTKPEQNFFELHPQYGVEVGKKAGLPNIVLEVIESHHEHLDGSGYPKKLKADAIRMPTRIVTIANVYDNLCNHIDPNQSLTPHEALSTMYAHRRAQFDPAVMATMIKSLGVYPPGTIVRLSNEAIGLVMNVNVGKPLRPRVLVYDADIPKEDAIILDLAEEGSDLSISASIRPGLLPKAIFDYLNPRKRVNYYFDSSAKQSGNQSQAGKA
jgi:putative nucleotidyltransferase with HDIG domain